MTDTKPALIRGDIVYSRSEQWHGRNGYRIHIEVEELVHPVMRGASLRTHRLWENGGLSSGGAYSWSLIDAIERADYLVQRCISAKNEMLEIRANRLAAENSALRAEIEALKEQREYTEVS